MKLLLCSASPRRREYLERLGLRFQVAVPHIDETPRPGEQAADYVRRMAREKAQACALPGALALAADTIVVAGRPEEVLGKPRDRSDAKRMLRLLSGIEHRVITAVCVGSELRSVTTLVKFRPLSEEQIRWLADSGDGDDKAGAYAVQGLAGAFVERIEGSFSNVVGLPLAETLEMLAQAGVELPCKG
jgi:septum formation protein